MTSDAALVEDHKKLQSPSAGVFLLARAIASAERLRIVTKWRLISKKTDQDPISEHLNYGFTIICNTCGNINVSIYELFYDGEYEGWDMRCNDKECPSRKKKGR